MPYSFLLRLSEHIHTQRRQVYGWRTTPVRTIDGLPKAIMAKYPTPPPELCARVDAQSRSQDES